MPDVALTNVPALDFASAVPADLFSDAPAAPDTVDTAPASADTPEAAFESVAEVETAPEDETAIATEETTETPEPEAEQTEEPPAEPEAPPAEAPDALPDGVRKGKDSNGKDGLFVTPQRWETIYADHKAMREMSQAIGEPLTAEALQARNTAYLRSEELYSDLFSGDKELQRGVIDHFFEEAQAKRDAGEVGEDPMVPFTSTLYATLKDRNAATQGGDPAWSELRMNAAKDLVNELFHEAAASGDENAFLSMQHVVRMLTKAGTEVSDVAQLRQMAERSGLPFYTKAEMQGLSKGESPEALLRKQVEQLQSQLNGRGATSQAAQFETWQATTQQESKSAILNKGVKEALAEDSQKGAWKGNQKAFQQLVEEPLHREVTKALQSDPTLSSRIARLESEAKRSVSAQARDAKRQQIVTAISIRARQIADANKKSILADAAQTLSGQSTARNQRLSAAQSQRGPSGPGSPPPRSIAPKQTIEAGGFFDAKEQRARLAQLLS
jgi:hypothetical protein